MSRYPECDGLVDVVVEHPSRRSSSLFCSAIGSDRRRLRRKAGPGVGVGVQAFICFDGVGERSGEDSPGGRQEKCGELDSFRGFSLVLSP